MGKQFEVTALVDLLPKSVRWLSYKVVQEYFLKLSNVPADELTLTVV